MTGSYIVLELQTDAEGNVASIMNSYDNINQADSAYYLALSSAAISSVKIHTLMMFTPTGQTIKSDYYKHATESVEASEE